MGINARCQDSRKAGIVSGEGGVAYDLLGQVDPMDGLNCGVLYNLSDLEFELGQPALESRDFESDLWCGHLHPLVGQDAFGSHYRDVLKNLRFTAKEVNEGLLIEIRFQTCTPIGDQIGNDVSHDAGSRNVGFPIQIMYCGSFEIGESGGAVDELVLDELRSDVDDFTMGQIGEQEVIESLTAMAGMDGIGGFELEESTFVYEHINEVGFDERAVHQADFRLENDAVQAIC